MSTGFNSSRVLIDISGKAIQTIREACGVSPHMSSGILKRKMAAAVQDEILNPKAEYPPMEGGEHDFVAVLKPVVGVIDMERDAYLIVKKNTEYPHISEWVVPTVLTEKDYQSRVEARRHASKLSSLKDNQVLQAALQSAPAIDNLFFEHSIVVLRTDKPGMAKGFNEKEDAGDYVSRMIDGGADADNIRIFEYKPLKVKITF